MSANNDSHPAGCNRPSHKEHLCYLALALVNPPGQVPVITQREYQTLVSEPRFQCRTCGRVAKNAVNLCEPEKLRLSESCTSSVHDEHLCQIVARAIVEGKAMVNCGGWPTPVGREDLVRDPQYRCAKCGRVAKSRGNLCAPVQPVFGGSG